MKTDWLIGGGEMGNLIRSKDWSTTPLGPRESWPESLRTTVNLCLASNFPISLAWGPHHVQIYNDGYWPICGGKHPYSLGQDFRVCWASAWPVIGESFDRALAGQTGFFVNQQIFLDREGYLEETFFTFSFSPIRDETGEIAGLFHPVTEVTQQSLAERRLQVLRDLAKQTADVKTVDSACAKIVETLAGHPLDLPFVLFYWLNDAGTQAHLTGFAGISAGTNLSPETLDLTAPHNPDQPFAEALRSDAVLEIEDLIARFGPSACAPYPEPVKQAFVLPIMVPGAAQALGFLMVGVSARRPLDAAYRTFYAMLRESVTTTIITARTYEEERKRAEALAEIDRAKTVFFSNVSHEFRTPLTLILGPIEDELAESVDPLPPERYERLQTAHRNSLRLLRLVNNLLDFSRIEAGRIQANYEATDLAVSTAELASNFRSACERAGLNLIVDCPPLPESLFVDREMWEKIVLNLLANAFKHTFTGSITVALRWCGDHAELTVTDTGVGIPVAELPRIFERFHRVKGAQARTHEGTGIGLALVQELARLHGGSVSVVSEEGKGSAFTVTISAERAVRSVDAVPSGATQLSTATPAAVFREEAQRWLPSEQKLAPKSPLNGPHQQLSADKPAPSVVPRQIIVWADDNADVRDYVSRLLSPHYQVVAVADGLRALEALRACLPDLILTDVMMPGLDGFGLLRAVREDARTRTIPVIMLSARAGEESRVEGLEHGADDYLVKPFSARELLAKIKSQLELSAVRKTAELQRFNRELAQRVREQTVELAAANKELEAFSYSVSHDLRAPLRAIHGFSRIVCEDYAAQLPPEARGYLNDVLANAVRMTQMVNDLLDFARLSRQALKTTRVATQRLVAQCLEELRGTHAGRTVDLRIAELPSCQADATLLKHVWMNLLSNAIKYTNKREVAVIEVGYQVGSEGSAFFVKDNGAGFNMTYAHKLFGVFQRLHRSEDFEGTGVGLALVQRIVHRHGGRIWAESEPNKGATFSFTLDGKTAS